MDLKNDIKQNHYKSKFYLTEKQKFHISSLCYYLAIIFLFIFSLEGQSLENYNLKAGLIVGGIFPTVTILYYFNHYLGNKSSTKRSFSSWFLPSIFVQLIIIFGFIITLGGKGEFGYKDSMYIGYYEYGKIFYTYENLIKEYENGKLKNSELVETQKQIEQIFKPYFDTEGWNSSEMFLKLTRSIKAIPFEIALTFGFLGALIFCLRDVIKRFNNIDLYPKVLVFYGVRFIISGSLSVTLSYLVIGKWTVVGAPIVFFMIGYFPERVIFYFDEKMSEYLGVSKFKPKPIPLSLVQGITADKAIKLRDIDIEDVQNLATANIEKMSRNLPFDKALICDWIAQSILILYFPLDIEKFRSAGIRSIMDLQECVFESKTEESKSCAQLIGLNPSQCEFINNLMSLDYMKIRLKELGECLSLEYKERCQVKQE